jgi:probable selenium-dependent hydroxylase accessory protein YqeC
LYSADSFFYESLIAAFALTEHRRIIALVGAGGKTSLMYALARAFVLRGGRVVTTTTTRILPPETAESPVLILLKDFPDLTVVSNRIDHLRHVTLGAELHDGKVRGLSVLPQPLLKAADHFLIEADGARGKSIKAPAEHEPVIPPSADIVIPVIGLDALGLPISPETVFRLERFLEITGTISRARLRARDLARLLLHPLGSVKNVPKSAVVVPFLNKAEDQTRKSAAAEISERILEADGSRIGRIVVGSLKGRFVEAIVKPTTS